MPRKEPRPRYHYGDDTNHISTYGWGVSIDNVLTIPDEIRVRKLLKSLGGVHRPDIDEIYQFNFLTYQFTSIRKAKQAVSELKKIEIDAFTINLGQADGSRHYNDWSYYEDLKLMCGI